jgi:hypothetical protein
VLRLNTWAEQKASRAVAGGFGLQCHADGRTTGREEYEWFRGKTRPRSLGTELSLVIYRLEQAWCLGLRLGVVVLR